MPLNFKNTSEIKVPKSLVEQIIGQDEAVNIIKKAARQRRHVLLIGESGTGKSLTGQALAELLPKEDMVDVLSVHNPVDENTPAIKVVPRGQGLRLINSAKMQLMGSMKSQNLIYFILVVLAVITPWWVRSQYGDIMAAASLIGSMIFLASFVLFMNLNKRMKGSTFIPKLLIDNSKVKTAPFFDASGAHAGALLGDCLHDPLQSFSDNNIIIFTNTQTINKNTNLLLQLQAQPINKIVNKTIMDKKQIKQKNHIAVFTDKNELAVLGEKNNSIEPINVLSVNKHKNLHKNLIKIKTIFGKELIVTPEHKIATRNIFGKIVYKKASKLTKFDQVVTLDLS